MEFYHFVYIILTLIIWSISYLHTGKYVKPKWKQFGKFIFYITVSIILIFWVKHYSLIFIIGHQLLGLLFHIKVCKQNGINWINCKPTEEYLKLHKLWAQGKFKE